MVFNPNDSAMPGRRISASINKVFSICPSAKAWLRASVVLPSPGTEEVTTNTFCCVSMPDNIMPVRIVRIDSENWEFGSFKKTHCGRNGCFFSTLSFCRVPSKGRPNFCSTSSLSFSVLSRYSNKNANRVENSKPNTKLITTINFFLGL